MDILVHHVTYTSRMLRSTSGAGKSGATGPTSFLSLE